MKAKSKNIYIVFLVMLFCIQCSSNVRSLIRSTTFHGLKYETLDVKKLKNVRSKENDNNIIRIERDSINVKYFEKNKNSNNIIQIVDNGDGFTKEEYYETSKYGISKFSIFRSNGQLKRQYEQYYPMLESAGKAFCAGFIGGLEAFFDEKGNLISYKNEPIDDEGYNLPFEKILEELRIEGINLSCDKQIFLNRLSLDDLRIFNISEGDVYATNMSEDKHFWLIIYDHKGVGSASYVGNPIYILGGNTGHLIYSGSVQHRH